MPLTRLRTGNDHSSV